MIALRVATLAFVLLAGVAQAAETGSPVSSPVANAAPATALPAPPVPLEYPGVQAARPVPAPPDRLSSASSEVQAVVQWIAASRDNAGLPFLVVDKVNARTYAFNAAAQLRATAPVLLGMGRGDVMLVPNDAPMSAIPPAKRITPAGRYRSWLMKDADGKQVLSIDYDAAISMHVVVPGKPVERRAARLASETADDNRISFGCINVPPAFFAEVVSPDFTPAKGVVYILPETKPAAQLFGFEPPAARPADGPAPATAAPVPAAVEVPQTAPASGTPVHSVSGAR